MSENRILRTAVNTISDIQLDTTKKTSIARKQCTDFMKRMAIEKLDRGEELQYFYLYTIIEEFHVQTQNIFIALVFGGEFDMVEEVWHDPEIVAIRELCQ